MSEKSFEESSQSSATPLNRRSKISYSSNNKRVADAMNSSRHLEAKRRLSTINPYPSHGNTISPQPSHGSTTPDSSRELEVHFSKETVMTTSLTSHSSQEARHKTFSVLQNPNDKDDIQRHVDEIEEQVKNGFDLLAPENITDDPACDPENPVYVDQVAIWDAYSLMKRVGADIQRTPCTRSRLSEEFGCEIYFKKDFMQVTGSFKERGARYFCEKLALDKKKLGVVTASAGNHAQALARHGKITGTAVTVVMPEQAPLVKVDSCRKLGARVVLHGNSFAAAKALAQMLAKNSGAVYVNGYDHPHILAGQGSIGMQNL